MSRGARRPAPRYGGWSVEVPRQGDVSVSEEDPGRDTYPDADRAAVRDEPAPSARVPLDRERIVAAALDRGAVEGEDALRDFGQLGVARDEYELVPLAVGSPKRSAALPQVPTTAEAPSPRSWSSTSRWSATGS